MATTPQESLTLAIETSTGDGAVALGRGDAVIAAAALSPKRRHNVDLMSTVASLCDAHRVQPRDLDAAIVSLGPGSFTGLRVAIATVKMLALSRKLRVVGIPTLDVLLAQHPGHAVALNIKRDTSWSGAPGHAPALHPLDEVRAWNLPIIADTIEGATPARPAVTVLYQLGVARLAAGETDNPATLAPLYIREPEAVTLWEARHNANL